MIMVSRLIISAWRFRQVFFLVCMCISTIFSCSGCSLIKGPGPAPRYFVLSPVDLNCKGKWYGEKNLDAQPAEMAPKETGAEGVIVGPVEIPAYLDRPQMVERRQGNRLVISELNRWAEPVDRSIERVVSIDLTRLSDGEFEACAFSQKLSPCETYPGLRVLISVYSFEPRQDGRVVLDVQWRIKSLDSDGKVLERRRCFSVKAKDASIDSITKAMDALLGELAQDILSGLREFFRH